MIKFDDNEEYWRWVDKMQNKKILDEYFDCDGQIQYLKVYDKISEIF